MLVALYANGDPNKGDRAAVWWVERLGNARRCRSWWGDAGEMGQAGAGLQAWLAGHLGRDGGRAPCADRGRRLLQLAEARALVALLERHGIPCDGYPSWAAWLADLEGEVE